MAEIKKRTKNNVGWLILANPARHNALTQHAWEAIPPALAEMVDEGTRAIIIMGEGASFCAGADISEFDTVRKDAASAAVYEKANADAFAAIGKVSVPTIAAIDGYCLGGGFGIACACDLRLATSEATFGVPAARLGLAYPVEAMADIVAAVGTQNAKHLLFTARRYDAAHMKAIGFLLNIVAQENLAKEAEAMAVEIAALAPLTHAATKAAIDAAQSLNSSAADALGNVTFSSQDYAEGRAAFREKRPARFTGR
ncbi:enoyl-CoA hydratase-related protein [Pseudahrensia aquimaris]|uniref:Enoyl-CoA hydratase-related protein n=1 Tax=Pseudahrensia aquimaris TaxID=744461 RepID=A0ABW3FF71_9HYPH